MEFFLMGLTLPLATTLATLAIICQALSVLLVLLLVRKRTAQGKLEWVARHGVLLMFIVALTATLGSLFFSEIALFAPCKLCWFQRIFMYPQVFLLGYALWKRDVSVVPLVLLLSVVGIAVSIFHYSEQVLSMLDPIGHDSSVPCDLSGISCRATYIIEYGYITIPMLALTAFLCLILISTTVLLFQKKKTTPKKAKPQHVSKLSVVALFLSVIALALAFTMQSKTVVDDDSALPLVLTPKDQLDVIMAEEGIHWTHTPAVPSPITRTTQRKVIVEWEATELVGDLDPDGGVQYEFWGFEGSAPGPVLRVRQGDLVEIRLTNNIESNHPHNIDFHFSTGPGGGASALNVAPGETAIVHLRALEPGFFMYHCATPDIPTHIANGMYGGVIVDPADAPLPPVDYELAVVQSEFYLQSTEPGVQALDLDKLDAEEPSYVVFNGQVGSLTGENSPYVSVGDSVRLYVLNAGPQLISSFHVIGEIFDRVYREGDLLSPPGRGIQSTLVPAGGSSVVDFTIDVPGTYILVDHAIARAIHKGAIGTIIAEGPDNFEIFESIQSNEVKEHTHDGEQEYDAMDKPEETSEEFVEAMIEPAENEVVVRILKDSMKRDDNPDNDYSPRVLTVKKGTTVTWVNEDRGVHTVTARDRTFNSGNMSRNKRWSYTFSETGEFEYYCIPHPWMSGKVVVEE